MGRITIFTSAGCPECRHVKKALKSRSIPFEEIDIALHPERRADMIALSDALSAPQVFFNNTHIGGTDETLTVLREWDNDVKFSVYDSPKERYDMEIGSFSREKLDPRLATPLSQRPSLAGSRRRSPKKEAKRQQPQDEEVILPDGSSVPVFTMTKQLLAYMPRSDLRRRARIYANCFRGEEGVDALMRLYNVRDRSAATRFGQTLLRRGLIHHITNDSTFKDDPRKYYRLQPYNEPKVLNSFRVWRRDDLKPIRYLDPMKTLLGLTELMDEIISGATDPETGAVDFLSSELDHLSSTFEEAACRLRIVDMGTLDTTEAKKAFGIGLYNLMIRHAFVKIGIPTSHNPTFYNKVSYNVSGHVFTLNDVEHGLLRANTKPPHKLTRPFSSSDKRREFALETVDPRIHFAINCGARSSPPVYAYTAEAVEEELRIATRRYFAKDANVTIDEEAGEVTLPMMMKWYTSDFAPSISQLPEVVVTFLVGERKDRLQRMLMTQGGAVKVQFHHFDWRPNASFVTENSSSPSRGGVKGKGSWLLQMTPFRRDHGRLTAPLKSPQLLVVYEPHGRAESSPRTASKNLSPSAANDSDDESEYYGVETPSARVSVPERLSTSSDSDDDVDDPEWMSMIDRGATPVTRDLFGDECSWAETRSEFSRVFSMADLY